MTYYVAIDGKSYRLDLNQIDGAWSCRVDGSEVKVDAVLARPNVLSLRLGDKAFEVKCERVGSDIHIWVGSQRLRRRSATRGRCGGESGQPMTRVQGSLPHRCRAKSFGFFSVRDRPWMLAQAFSLSRQ